MDNDETYSDGPDQNSKDEYISLDTHTTYKSKVENVSSTLLL